MEASTGSEHVADTVKAAVMMARKEKKKKKRCANVLLVDAALHVLTANKNVQPIAVWDPMKEYDALKRNGYNECTIWKQRNCVERADERAAERKRAHEAMDRGSDQTANGSEDEPAQKKWSVLFCLLVDITQQGDLTMIAFSCILS